MKNAKEEEGKYGTKYSFVPYFPPPLESECFDQKVREIDKLVVGFGKRNAGTVFRGLGKAVFSQGHRLSGGQI